MSEGQDQGPKKYEKDQVEEAGFVRFIFPALKEKYKKGERKKEQDGHREQDERLEEIVGGDPE